MTLLGTQNDLDSNIRNFIVGLLNGRLADSIDLALATKQAHWNLRGLQFIAVHEMIDAFRNEIDGHVDTIAERIAQLGGIALTTSQVVARGTSLTPYPTDIYKIEDHLAALIDRFGKVAQSIRSSVTEAEEAGDANTADILTAYSRALDKSLWFLEAHGQISV